LQSNFGEGSKNFLLVPKSKIAENGDYNLSGERYRVATDYSKAKWDMVELGEVCEVKKGSAITKKDSIEGFVPVIAGGQSPAYYHNQSNRFGKTITVSASGAYAGFINYFKIPIFASDCSTIQSKNETTIKTEFVFNILKGIQEKIYKLQTGGGQPHVYSKDLIKLKIPLPPLEIQEQIVTELDGYSSIIAGAKQIVANWKPKIDTDPSWEMVTFDKILDRVSSSIDPKNKQGEVFYVGLENIESNSGSIMGNLITNYQEIKSLKNSFKSGDILYGKLRPNLNKSWLANCEGICSTDILVFRAKENSDTNFYWYLMLSEEFVNEVMTGIKGAQLPRVGFEYLRNIILPLPPLETQQQIVSQIEAERTLVESAKKLIEIYEQKTKAVIKKLWEE
jgi:type I restriction enzyme M protein